MVRQYFLINSMKSITQQFVEILKKSSLSTGEKIPLLFDLISVVESRDQEMLTLFEGYCDADIVGDLPEELEQKMADTI